MPGFGPIGSSPLAALPGPPPIPVATVIAGILADDDSLFPRIAIVTSGALVDDDLTALLTIFLAEGILFAQHTPNLSTATVRALSGLELGERYTAVYRMLLTEHIAFDDDLTLSATAINHVIDGLILAGVVKSQSDALVAVVVGIAFAALARNMKQNTVTSGFAVDDLVAKLLTTAQALVSGILLDDNETDRATLFTVVKSGFALDETLTSVANAINAIREGIGFGL